MDFYEVLDQVIDLLRHRRRVSYRALKRQFRLDDDYIDDLKVELIKSQRLAVDEDGEVLVWVPSPMSYTPRHLAERIRAEQAALEARGAPDGERKTITALFADIKDSMDLLEDLDPEEARRVIDPALQIMMDAVHRYEGYVAQSLGDGIFALFGAPIALEDHAQRALYAGLYMQETLKPYANTLRGEQGLNLQIRVGVSTGDVVVRAIRTDDLHMDYVPVGHAIGLASRMEKLAAPGAIRVTEQTYRLATGHFDFEALGPTQVKGLREPIEAYDVRGAGPLRTRLQVAARRGLVQFVGRQQELQQMQQALDMAARGHGQMVAVVGEPGVGKSRLVHEFAQGVPHGFLVLDTFALSYGTTFPYLPLIELLQRYFKIIPQDDARQRQEKVTGSVLALDRHLHDTVPYLLTLLGVSDTSLSLTHMDPRVKRRRTFEALKRLLVRESLNQPVVLTIEDLQWLDGESQTFLDVLVESLPTAHILLLVNYRPEYQHGWESNAYYWRLRLNPLGRAMAVALLTTLLGDSASLRALKDFILAKTAGNPFFMEEMVQALFDQGILVRNGDDGSPALTQPLTTIQIPPTVQGVLAARVDRLTADDKALLQTLAVLGPVFSLSLIRRMLDQSEPFLVEKLAHFQTAEFLYEQPAFPEPEYVFKHALTQDVAYNSLLMERRRELHERAALAIEAVYGDRLEEQYSALAHHYSCSTNVEKAVHYLQRAGHQAAHRAAHTDAIHHFTRGLELLQSLADPPGRMHKELLLQLSIGASRMTLQGLAAPEVGQAYSRAHQLCQQIGDTPRWYRVLWGLAMFHFQRGQLQTARQLAEQCLTLAQHRHDPGTLLEAHHVLGGMYFWIGDFVRAREHAERALDLYDPQKHRAYASRYVMNDPVVGSLHYLALPLWGLGYPDQALQRSHEGVRLARELAHPASLVFALGFEGMLHQLRWEVQAAYERAEDTLTLATEQGFAIYAAGVPIIRGWALVPQGQQETGLAQIRQGLEAYRAKGAELGAPWALALLAEAYRKAEQAEAGLRAVDEALVVAGTNGEHWYDAEIYRLKGELLLHVDRGVWPAPWTPEACFQKALHVARAQQAKSWELRAAVSLARWWQHQGERAEARRVLAEVYEWFTEGFDTADLKAARALLEALSP
ncbi:MAG: adenylate/guanylate cyclase domain-containing protein [Candidatus Tectomicrobia bacterium]